MRYISLRLQLVIAFSITFLLIILLSTTVFFPMVRDTFRQDIYRRLYTVYENFDINFIDDDHEWKYFNSGIIYINEKNDIYYSNNISKVASMDSIYIIINDVKNNTETTQEFKFNNKDINESIYVLGKKKTGSIIITMINENSIKYFSEKSANRLLYVIFIIFIFSILVLFIWSNKIVKRVNRLKMAIENFEDKNIDEDKVKGRDEISKLSQSFIELKNRLYIEEQQKQELFQNISHDLKTPLTTIKSFAEAIEDNLCPKNDILGTARIIVEQSEILEKKVNQIMNLNKINYIIDNNYYIEDVFIATIINQLVPIYKTKAPNLSIDTSLDDTSFSGNYESWKIVIENILENAIRYAKSNIVITLYHGVLEVFNDGPNIEQSIFESMFIPYKKGQNGQFGLGLAIVYKTLKTFNYNIEVCNIDKGVIFRIF